MYRSKLCVTTNEINGFLIQNCAQGCRIGWYKNAYRSFRGFRCPQV